MKTVSIFSFHLYFQRRRGSMHWICDSLRASGHDVRFITCDFSLLTKLKGDRRTEFGEVRGVNTLERIDASLSVGVVSTLWHPVGRATSLAGNVLNRLTSWYPGPHASVVREFARGSDLIVVESCGGLLMLDAIRSATEAPVVYRVSDNLAVVRPVPCLLEAERRAVASVETVSLASEHLARSLGVKANLRFDSMGLDKKAFDEAAESPYAPDGRPKVVISGSSGLDTQSLRIAAEALPDFDFIQFGSANDIPTLPNIRLMGERPFKELVPWVKFADIGFAPYLVKPGFEYQSEHSNRLLQYTYSALPSVVPNELCSDSKPHFLGYRANDRNSIVQSLRAAATFDRSKVPVNSVNDWDQLAQRILLSTDLARA